MFVNYVMKYLNSLRDKNKNGIAKGLKPIDYLTLGFIGISAVLIVSWLVFVIIPGP